MAASAAFFAAVAAEAIPQGLAFQVIPNTLLPRRSIVGGATPSSHLASEGEEVATLDSQAIELKDDLVALAAATNRGVSTRS